MSLDHGKMMSSINNNVTNFKERIMERMRQGDAYNDIIQFIHEYSFPELVEEDYTKRKRIKNVIPFHEKCIAKRANGEQCSRRKKKGTEFCGTHSKACPHGVISLSTSEGATETKPSVVKKQVEVWLEDINGIMYWINATGTVYHPDDIRNNVENPRVIAHYEVSEDDVYKITEEIH
jgi:hypothetical protein